MKLSTNKENILKFSKESSKKEFSKKFSICTLVTDYQEYKEMTDSFIKGGFGLEVCEYRHIDNSEGNKMDGFEALNHFAKTSVGEYVLVVHQDVVLLEDGINRLLDCIAKMDEKDPSWAVLGNAGGVCLGVRAISITDSSGTYRSDNLPLPVSSLDENFLLLKGSAYLAVSSDLNGFHLFGTDLCLMARTLGYSCWVIDFNLYHKSKGFCNDAFFVLREKMKKKYLYAFRNRYIQTTVTRFYLSNSVLKNKFFNISIIGFIHKRAQSSWFKLKGYSKFNKKNLDE